MEWLNSSLNSARVLPSNVDGGLNEPNRLYYDKLTGRLYVSEYTGKRVLAFDNVVNIYALLRMV